MNEPNMGSSPELPPDEARMWRMFDASEGPKEDFPPNLEIRNLFSGELEHEKLTDVSDELLRVADLTRFLKSFGVHGILFRASSDPLIGEMFAGLVDNDFSNAGEGKVDFFRSCLKVDTTCRKLAEEVLAISKYKHLTAVHGKIAPLKECLEGFVVGSSSLVEIVEDFLSNPRPIVDPLGHSLGLENLNRSGSFFNYNARCLQVRECDSFRLASALEDLKSFVERSLKHSY